MKITEIIYEATLNPDNEMLEVMKQVLDAVNSDYLEFLNSNNDVDDIEELAELLNDEIEAEELPVVVHVNHEPRKDPNEYISAVASWEGDEDKGIDIILHAKNLEGTWGPKTFKSIVLKALAHETIHFNQYDRMGKEKLGKTLSGHQKGTELVKKGGTARDWERSYLRDPHELMAYGHDLAGEIMDMENPNEVIRNIEKYKNELPVYKKFRSIFHKEAPQIKNLLKYAVQYLKNDL
jgi:hypothetical protein